MERPPVGKKEWIDVDEWGMKDGGWRIAVGG
jgi:hypothetical protein